MNIDQLYQLYVQHPIVETDTRNLKDGAIFFALKGPNFNGNHYLQQALEKGAAYCVADEETDFKSDKIIRVNDSLETLQQLAHHHRKQFNIPFIAITGSNGKTTTKELLSQVLSKKYITYTTFGNLNNHIGVPLTLLRIKPDAQMAVIEMGANHQQEIAGYCKYAMPTHGIITNIGKAHLEGFGGEEGVRKGKGELFDYLREHNGVAFINNDLPYLVPISNGIDHIITYGETTGAYTGKVVNSDSMLEVSINGGAQLPLIKTQLVGNYNLPNVLAAVCIGKTFGVADKDIKDALESYVPSNSRSQMLQQGSNTIILDAYNANPSSMRAAINNFAAMEGQNKVLILGGMMELGSESILEHSAIVALINSLPWKQVVLVGKDYVQLPEGFIHFETVQQAQQWYRQQAMEHAQILIKGSRSMQMEKVLQ